MASKSGGAFSAAIDMRGLMPSFWGNGVPE
jgi:hypothetical protein